jgi:hypothetical protein
VCERVLNANVFEYSHMRLVEVEIDEICLEILIENAIYVRYKRIFEMSSKRVCL